MFDHRANRTTALSPRIGIARTTPSIRCSDGRRHQLKMGMVTMFCIRQNLRQRNLKKSHLYGFYFHDTHYL